MSSNPETKFKEKVRIKLNALPKSHWFKIQQVSLRGVPDFLGVVNGRFVALELKTETGRVAPLQEYHIKKLEEAGAYACIVRPSTWDEVYKELQEIAMSY
jgi:hypothetical protein